jgi:O-antigen/teichoic acid export membrane protein
MPPALLRKVATLGSGIALGQGILLLATPVLSRLYAPTDFGLFGVLIAIASILAVGSNGRYFLAIVQPREDDDAAGLVGLGLTLTVAFCAVTAIALGLSATFLARVMNAPGLASWWWSIPILTALAGWFDVLNYWQIRRERFGIVSRVQPLRSVVLVGIQGGLGAAGAGFAGLASGRLVADAVLVGGLMPHMRADFVQLTGWRRPSRWRELARRYRDFPLFSAPQGWLSAVSQYLPVLVLAWLLDDAVVGVFLMTHRILATPAMFLGKALRQVFYRELHGDDRSHHTSHRLWSQVTRYLAIGGALPTVIVVLWGSLLFPLLLGADWQLAGQFAAPLMVWQYLAVIAIPSHMILIAQGKQRWHLSVECVFLAVRFVGLVVGEHQGGATGAVIGFALAGIAMQGILVVLAWRCLVIVRGEPSNA